MNIKRILPNENKNKIDFTRIILKFPSKTKIWLFLLFSIYKKKKMKNFIRLRKLKRQIWDEHLENATLFSISAFLLLSILFTCLWWIVIEYYSSFSSHDNNISNAFMRIFFSFSSFSTFNKERMSNKESKKS